jgi:hypothetical protein
MARNLRVEPPAPARRRAEGAQRSVDGAGFPQAKRIPFATQLCRSPFDLSN